MVESANSPLNPFLLYSGCERAKNKSPALTSRESITKDVTSRSAKAGSRLRSIAERVVNYGFEFQVSNNALS